ncbi:MULTISPECIES: hypothetical protein [unclassified Novosphingobium]|uniref:hypothetical protein n=1 Tax=unclassified Novosphingobium TaxID=2644732 RepID=UPI00146E47BB|nr:MULTISPECIES: hypothetical protein [unclassified Novosphingobium]NMN06507.1 hypothetical protein [Novosphingobium sp. SG919]NMN89045.1 hypothetical protein [Novosphingobium sp. SG916]
MRYSLKVAPERLLPADAPCFAWAVPNSESGGFPGFFHARAANEHQMNAKDWDYSPIIWMMYSHG